MTIAECASCGSNNEMSAGKLMDAVCFSCGAKLIQEAVPFEITDKELAQSLDIKQDHQPEEVDVNKWIGKIGDHEKQTKYVEDGFWSKVKRHAAKVPFAKEVVTLYYCSADPKTPIATKITAIGALAYWILPIDLIPDFLPVVGFVDDATAVFVAYKAISGQITEEHREKAEQFFILNKNVKLINQES
ncbi:YkvA family protein [Paenibacillus sp. FSL H8-0548]|uniref:YkvA family protein n=1 Tax=Paenibacillus sp. FSL H8-0548 TaxID=1920422 RepID=UPI002116F081|nr:YkvA family protein [Paenibacillus sp. FSL H8-0548]